MRVFIHWLLLATSVTAADFGLAGIIVDGSGSRVVLVDLQTGQTSPFLEIDRFWNGCRVTKIDSQSETVTIRRERGESTLRMRASHVVPIRSGSGKTSLVPRLSQGTFRIVDGKMVYSPDALLDFGSFAVRAHDGPMESDESSIRGTFYYTGENGLEQIAVNGTLTISDAGTPRIKAKEFRIVVPATK